MGRKYLSDKDKRRLRRLQKAMDRQDDDFRNERLAHRDAKNTPWTNPEGQEQARAIQHLPEVTGSWGPYSDLATRQLQEAGEVYAHPRARWPEADNDNEKDAA